MSKNSNDQNIVAESKVLTTSMSRTVAKYTALFAAIGLLIGVVVMAILNFGVPEMLSSLVGQVAMEEVVAHNASTEESDPSLKTNALINLDSIIADNEIAFPAVDEYGNHTKYDGNSHKLELMNTDKLPAGVTVSYINNEHTDAGTHYVVAVLSGAGYETAVIEGYFVIGKATFNTNVTDTNNAIRFENKIVKYEEGNGHTIEVGGDLPADTKVTYYYNNVLLQYDENNDNRPVEHGVYYVTAVIENKNYKTITLTATLKIVDISKLVYFDNVGEDGTIQLTYNGQEQGIALNISKLEEVEGFKDKIVVSYPDGNYFTRVYEYDIVAKVSVAVEGFEGVEVEVSVKVVVNQGDINSIYGISFGIQDVGTDGNGDALEYSENNKELVINNLPDHIVPTVYLVTGEGENLVYTEIKEDDIRNPGDYRLAIKLVDTTGNCKNYSSENENLLTYEFTIAKRNINKGNSFSIANVETKYSTQDVDGKKVGKVNNLVMTFANVDKLPGTILGDKLVVEFKSGDASKVVVFTFAKVEGAEDDYIISYTMDGVENEDYVIIRNSKGKYEFVIPFDFVDYGEYNISAVIYENDFDAEARLTAKMFIDYAKLSGVSVKSNQWVIADESFHAPKVVGAPKGATVEFFDKNGNSVEGFKYVGLHNVKVVVTNGNYQTTIDNVRYIVVFNPVIALIGMLVGMLMGVLVGAIVGVVTNTKEKTSAKHFRGPGAIVANARGGILCESFAKNDNGGCVGRLYLSSKTLEFYAEDYKALKDNFLIDIDDIRNVKAIAPNKIQVYANKETYVFTVPDGTSDEWAELIIHA